MADDYELIDAGAGRRLERFGRHVVDRPAPAVVSPPCDPAAWSRTTLRFERGPTVARGATGVRGAAGAWQPADVEPWTVSIAGLELELRPAAAGQVGLFPEHLGLADWLEERIVAAAAPGHPPAVLNLFAYTGALTLAAARAGARVAHVDAQATAVAWARRNADLSGRDACPIRWLVEDAARFVRREGSRGNRYDGIVLDPPSWGHGRGGRAWRLVEDLDPLLADIAGLLDGPAPFVLLTAHGRGLSAAWLGERLATALGVDRRTIETGPLELVAGSGARLPAGAFARWTR